MGKGGKRRVKGMGGGTECTGARMGGCGFGFGEGGGGEEGGGWVVETVRWGVRKEMDKRGAEWACPDIHGGSLDAAEW